MNPFVITKPFLGVTEVHGVEPKLSALIPKMQTVYELHETHVLLACSFYLTAQTEPVGLKWHSGELSGANQSTVEFPVRAGREVFRVVQRPRTSLMLVGLRQRAHRRGVSILRQN